MQKGPYQRSFLKWAGGKYAALHHVFKTVPQSGEHWVEPFVGSATVALNTNYKSYTLADSNPVLIHLYRMIVRDVDHVITELTPLFTPENNSKERFYALKAEFNSSQELDRKAILFIYLNRHCYNGLMRFNKRKGEFNTSFGSYKTVYLPEQELRFFAEKLKHATFVHSCFKKLHIQTAEHRKTTVYCDPPYLKASKTANFTSYTSEGFTPEDHASLNALCKQWRADDAQVFVSNSDVPVLAALYPDLSKKKKFIVRRSISQKGHARAPAPEVLLVY